MNRSISNVSNARRGFAVVIWLGLGALAATPSCVSKGDTNVNGGGAGTMMPTGGSLCAQYCEKGKEKQCNISPQCQSNCEANATMCPGEFDTALECALSTTLVCSATGDPYSSQCQNEFTAASNCLDGKTMTDPMCNTKATFNDCDTCCTSAYPDAEKKWEDALTNCACTDTSLCGGKCTSAALCGGTGTTSQACTDCLSSKCTTWVDTTCGSDAACKPYNDCFNKCPSN
jgi:hypothetical protein